MEFSILSRASFASVVAFVAVSGFSYADSPKPASSPDTFRGIFIENKGQWDARAQFLCQTQGTDQWLTNEGLVLDFHKFVPDSGSTRKRPSGTVQGHVVKISFTNARATQITGVRRREGKYNYLLGNDETKWTTGARSFSEVRAEQPYDGISVRYYVDQGKPRYDLIVKPGADPSQVGLNIEGANGVRVLDNGDLAIDTSLGTVEERGLVAYQEQNGTRTPINCRLVQEDNTIRFDTGSYDPSKPLIIDPLIYSTLLGCTNGTDTVTGVAATPSGNAVISGYTTATNLPVSTGAYQTGRGASQYVVTVIELNSTGTAPVFATYLGGSNFQWANGIAVDSSGNPVVVGFTESSDFPVTAGAYQTTSTYWPNNVGFITKLNATGTGLVFSTLLGAGNGSVVILSVALDSSGNVLVGGNTESSTFPVTAGAYQTKFSNPNCSFVTKFNSTCSSIAYSTFLGTQYDVLVSVAVDAPGYAYVAGNTLKSDIPASAGAFQTKNNSTSGFYNGFIVKFNATYSALTYATYLGGSDNDAIAGLVVDSLDNAIVCGTADSTNFPVTTGAFQTKSMSPANQAAGFVTKLNGSATKLGFSTYLSGADGGTGLNGIALDSNDEPVVVGYTSGHYPITNGAYLYTSGTGETVAVLTQLMANGTGLLYSTLFGGTSGVGDSGDEVAINSTGQAIISGITTAVDFPTTAGAWQTFVDTNGEPFAACFTLSPSTTDTLNNFYLQPSVIAGETAEGSAYLTGPATGQLFYVKLTGSGPVSFPSKDYVPLGSSKATFLITTQSVTTAATVSITASLGSVSITKNIQVVPMGIKDLSLNPSQLIGGNDSTATLVLTAFAGEEIPTVKVTTTGPISCPTSAKIPEGSDYVSFGVFTTGVTKVSAASITAAVGSYSKTVSFDVYPPFESASLTSTTVVGGSNISGSVTGYLPAPANGTLISIVPSSYTYTAGISFTIPSGQTKANFTFPTYACPANTVVSLKVFSGSTSQTLSVTLTPPPITGLTLHSSTIVGGTDVGAIVTVSSIVANPGLVISISSNNAAATVPMTVTIPAGLNYVSFAITTKAVTKSTPVTITVKEGSSSASSVLTITP